MRGSTMRDVALAAGVSISAVSYVLNDSRPVRADKRARIRQAMAALDYIPNRTAQVLKGSHTRLIGVLLPDLTNPIYGQIASSIEHVASTAGLLSIVGTTSRQADHQDSYLHALEASRVDGLIVRPTGLGEQRFLSADNRRAPLLLLMHDPPDGPGRVDSVIIDNAAGVRLAAEHLAEYGHTRIGCLAANLPAPPGLGRVEGFVGAVAELGLDPDQRLVQVGEPTAACGETLAAALIDLDDPPTALVATHNRLAVGALRLLRRRGVRVPEDVSLVAFGQPEFFALYPLDLTLMVQPFPALGQAAAELLLERITAGTTDEWLPRRLVLAPSLVRGASVARPPRTPGGRRSTAGWRGRRPGPGSAARPAHGAE
jgi:LacI family transcriptional regulator